MAIPGSVSLAQISLLRCVVTGLPRDTCLGLVEKVLPLAEIVPGSVCKEGRSVITFLMLIQPVPGSEATIGSPKVKSLQPGQRMT